MNASLLEIDGAQGEGGGQILRSALALSISTGRPFRIRNIRANRSKPGLLRQHATCVAAAAEVANARIAGGDPGSTELLFEPGSAREASTAASTLIEHSFAVGSAGGTGLVLQSILPALLALPAGPRLRVRVTGGTHNLAAPPFEFLEQSYLPAVHAMCAPRGEALRLRLERAGFYPAGGGEIVCDLPADYRLASATSAAPFQLHERGELREFRVRIRYAHLPESIASREASAVKRTLRYMRPEIPLSRNTIDCADSPGPGNAITIAVVSEHVTEVFSGFGQRGVRAERVVSQLCAQVAEYLQSDVPVGEYLADQLILPLVLGPGGSFTTGPLSSHTRTNIDVIRRFVDRSIECEPLETAAGGTPTRVRVTIGS